jgi:hypothetical protein
VKSNVIGLFLATIAIAIGVISIITSISVIESETGLYDKIFYSHVEPYNKQFIPMISNISNQVPPNEPIVVSLPSSQFAYFVGHKSIIPWSTYSEKSLVYFMVRNNLRYLVVYENFSKVDVDGLRQLFSSKGLKDLEEDFREIGEYAPSNHSRYHLYLLDKSWTWK